MPAPVAFPFGNCRISSDWKAKILTWLREEVEAADEERSRQVQRVKDWDRQYSGEPRTKTKNFPFMGASNMIVNITQMTGDAIIARQVRTIHGVQPFWTVKGLSQEVSKMNLAKPVERFLERQARREIASHKPEHPGMYFSTRDIIISSTKYGDCPFRYSWDPLNRRAYLYNPQTYEPELTYVPVRSGVACYPIRHENFLMPHDAVSVGAAQWDAEIIWQRYGDIMAQAAQGRYDKTECEKLKAWLTKHPHANLDERHRLAGVDVGLGRTVDIHHIQFRAPEKENGEEVEMDLAWHMDSDTVLRWTYNRYFGQWRERMLWSYYPVENYPRGRGICQMLGQYQEALSTVINQGIDNGTIANTKMFKVRKGSDIRPGAPIYAGKMWMLNDMKDLEEFSMGEINSSTFNFSLTLRDYSERASGVSDYNLGRESSVIGRRGTATTTLALIQESNRRFDFVTNDGREVASELGMRTLEMFQQFRPTGVPYLFLGQDGFAVQDVLRLPTGYLRDLFGVEITASSATINRDVEKANQQTLLSIANSYYLQLFQLVQLLVTPGIPPALVETGIRLSEASKRSFEKLLETYEQRDTTILSPDLRDIFNDITGSVQGAEGQQGLPNLEQLGPGGAGQAFQGAGDAQAAY